MYYAEYIYRKCAGCAQYAPEMMAEKPVGVVPLPQNNRSSDARPSTAANEDDTGYESRATESQTAESLAEVHTHQQCSQLTLPNPITDWAM